MKHSLDSGNFKLEQELHFENEFDQTYLKDFVNELYLTYEKYR